MALACLKPGFALLWLSLTYSLVAAAELPIPIGQVKSEIGQLPAQTTAAAGAPVLTLSDALDIAGRSSPLLEAGRAQVESALGAIVTARTYLNPEANGLAGNQMIRLPTSVPGLLQHWGYAQRIELPSVRRFRIEAAQYGKESSDFALAQRQLDVRAAVKGAFYAVLRRKGEREIAAQNLAIVEDFRRRIEVQVNTGEAARLELTRADAEVARVRTVAQGAELQVVNSIATLRSYLGVSATTPIDPSGRLSTPPVLLPLADLRQRMLSEYPALAAGRADIQRSQSVLNFEKAARVPQPTALAEYEQQPDLRFFRVGLSVPIPFFDRRRGPIQQAVAQTHEFDALQRERTLELTAALENAYGQYQIANQQVDSLEKGALRQSQAALAAAEAAYKFGERGIIDVLDAQRVLRSVRTDFLNAQFDREAALIQLEQLRALDLVVP